MNSPLRARSALLGTFLYLCIHSGICFAGTPSPVAGSDPPVASQPMVAIPGPLRSFERMAAISQKVPADKVLPLLARNVFVQGYDNGRPTEFLLLVDRYLQQARELQALTDPSGTIHISDCDHAGPLLQILGYRLRSGCGQKEVYLTTSSSERAFLTIDSGFPLTELEQDLRKNAPFTYRFPTSQVPVLIDENAWSALGGKRNTRSLIDLMIRDQSVARLYWAFSKMDAETRDRSRAFARTVSAAALRRGAGLLWKPDLYSVRAGAGARRSRRGSRMEGSGRRESDVTGRLCPAACFKRQRMAGGIL